MNNSLQKLAFVPSNICNYLLYLYAEWLLRCNSGVTLHLQHTKRCSAWITLSIRVTTVLYISLLS